MTNPAIVQASYPDEIDQAVNRFGDHEDMSAGRVLAWLSQFDEDDLPLAIEIIEAVRYFNAVNIRTMTRELFELASAELVARDLAHAAFVAVGGPASGSATVARVLREQLRGTPHRLVTMLELAQAPAGQFDAVVFVDDFSGTGSTLVRWWDTVEPIVRPINAEVFIGLLVLNEPARPLIEVFGQVIAVEELGPAQNTLSAVNETFTNDQKQRIRHYCAATGVSQALRSGYGNCALLLAFKHVCPNNSLPILWSDQSGWRPLFNRRAI
jgi:hypothetical protein